MGLGLAIAIAGVALAAALSGIGSSIGIGLAGQASTGVMSEKPEHFVKLMILSVLPGTQGIYGFVVAFLALGKLSPEGNLLSITIAQGWQMFFACLPIALAGLGSAIHQGRVCAGGAGMLAKQPEKLAAAMIFAAFVEFYAVLGLLISYFAIQRITF